MAEDENELEIVIHLTDGKALSYRQDDPITIEAILGGIQPARLFTERQIIIAGAYTISGYACGSVTRLDFIRRELPDFKTGRGGLDLTEISEAEFRDRYGLMEDEKAKRGKTWTAGESFEGFVELELTSGRSLFAELSLTQGSQLEQRQAVQNFLSGQTIVCGRRGGGVILVNPANVARWTLFPGLPEAPKNAWKAHYVGEEKKG